MTKTNCYDHRNNLKTTYYAFILHRPSQYSLDTYVLSKHILKNAFMIISFTFRRFASLAQDQSKYPSKVYYNFIAILAIFCASS